MLITNEYFNSLKKLIKKGMVLEKIIHSIKWVLILVKNGLKTTKDVQFVCKQKSHPLTLDTRGACLR